MSKENSGVGGGTIGFTGLLTIVFVTLKLTGFIDWSWWWVLSPILIHAALAIVVIMVGVIGAWRASR